VRRFVFLVYGLLVLTMAVEGVVPPLLPTFKGELGLSTLETSVLLAAPWGTMFALAVPIGAAADRLGARVVTLAGGVLLATGALLQGLAESFGVLLAGRALFGVALGIAWTAGIAWLAAQLTGGSSAVGGTSAAAAFGFVIGPAVGSVLAERLGTGAPFFVYGAAALVVTLALAAAPGIRAGHVEAHEPVFDTLRQAVREPRVLAAILMVLLSGLANGSTNLLVPLGLDEQGFSTVQIGVVFSSTAILMIVLSSAVARQGDALVKVRVAGLGLLVGAGAFILPAASNAAAVLVTFVLLRAVFSFALLSTITYPLAVSGARVAALRVGAVVGVVNVGWSLASTLGPVGAGALTQLVGTRGTFAAVCGLYAIVGSVVLAAGLRAPRALEGLRTKT